MCLQKLKVDALIDRVLLRDVVSVLTLTAERQLQFARELRRRDTAVAHMRHRIVADQIQAILRDEEQHSRQTHKANDDGGDPALGDIPKLQKHDRFRMREAADHREAPRAGQLPHAAAAVHLRERAWVRVSR